MKADIPSTNTVSISRNGQRQGNRTLSPTGMGAYGAQPDKPHGGSSADAAQEVRRTGRGTIFCRRFR